MSSKKNTEAATSSNLPALKIGSRVRCTEDSFLGRIVWCNGVSVKIRWDDGEQVTWRRDALAGKPIEILEADAASGEDLQSETPNADSATEQAVTTGLPQADQEGMPVVAEQVAVTEASAEAAPQAQEQTQAAAAAKPKRQPKAAVQRKEKKRSALDAAAKVLAEEGRAMTCQEMIEAMAAKGYWTSPGGKTPAATLYSAILREVATKGTNARFVKTQRGQFARKA
jgi:hypothetical protein